MVIVSQPTDEIRIRSHVSYFCRLAEFRGNFCCLLPCAASNSALTKKNYANFRYNRQIYVDFVDCKHSKRFSSGVHAREERRRTQNATGGEDGANLASLYVYRRKNVYAYMSSNSRFLKNIYPCSNFTQRLRNEMHRIVTTTAV